jgi:hypothetical protein
VRSRFVIGLVAAVVLASCGAGHESANGQVDGWSIGEGGPCTADVVRCEQMVDEATRHLAEREPNHPLIVAVTVHQDGLYPNLDGDLGVIFRSGGPPTIVLFRLADGTRRAMGLKYVLTDEIPTIFDHGPELRDEHSENRTAAPTI